MQQDKQALKKRPFYPAGALNRPSLRLAYVAVEADKRHSISSAVIAEQRLHLSTAGGLRYHLLISSDYCGGMFDLWRQAYNYVARASEPVR